jgi:hypothetical protein
MKPHEGEKSDDLSSQGVANELQGEPVGVADMAQIMAVSSSFLRQTQKLTSNAKLLGFSG